MSRGFCGTDRMTLSDGLRFITERLRLLPSDSAAVRIELPLKPVDPLGWAAAQPVEHKVYWRNRNGQAESAGAGVAERQFIDDTPGGVPIHEALKSISERVDLLPLGMRYYGGLRFDYANPPQRKGSAWDRFGRMCFCLPRTEVSRRGDEYSLVCNLTESDLSPDHIENIIDELGRMADGQLKLPEGANGHAPLDRDDSPNLDGWTEAVRRALSLFSAGRAEKIVLARKSEFRFDEELDGWNLLSRLREHTVDSHLFCFQPYPGHMFVGASPERLYRRIGRRIESEALAGTRRRGESEDKDRQLEDDLMRSEKDIREHLFVVNAMRDSLSALCREEIAISDLKVRKLAQVQHLCREFSGTLRLGINDADVIQRLHPTPAVNGTPTEDARRCIDELEPFDRGWYAGPVGWIERDSAEFAVAIRSGLVSGDRLALYSGAGIVSGSEPQSEWEEIEAKVSNFIKTVTSS